MSLTSAFPHKKPTQARSQETVDAIFEAAVQMLERREGEAPSVQAIAERAGVSVGSLYQYFPSKESLLSAVIGFHQRRAIASLERDLEAVRDLSGEEAARRLVGNLVGCKSRRRGIEHTLIRFFCRVGDLAVLTSHDREMNAAVERFIRSLGAQVRPVNVEVAAFLITNLLRSALLLSVVQAPERLEDPVFAEELVQMVVRYLAPSPSA